MADATAKPTIFISYSHKDRAELDYVRAHLGSVVGLGTVTVWDDNALQIGDDWKGDINSAIDACSVFILLVTCHSLGSRFIREVEVARVVPRWQAKQVRFCPIVVKPCHLDGYWWLAAANRRPKEGKALSELPDPARDREMAEIVGDMVKYLGAPAASADGLGSAANIPEPTRPKPSVPHIIDYARLPETPYRRLVGRDGELTMLDEAWVDRETNIISLVAWGGAGKTSLVKEWLVRLQNDNYRGAQAVLGWSFYSQGTKERATSAEQFLDWALDQFGIKGVAANPVAKGEALARALAGRRILLILDGIEPLQYGPGEQEGLLKDTGLRALLRAFAMTAPSAAHGLIVLTTRLAVRDVEHFRRTEDRPGSMLEVDLGRLSDEAGAALLQDNGVNGTARQLRYGAHDFDGHALALSLLASFLTRRFKGDIRQRDRVGPLTQNVDVRGHGHARRVMQAYETEWLKDEPILLSIMNLIGLFDRPATAGCIEALRREPIIKGLTDKLVGLSFEQWADAVAMLRDMRLLDPEDSSAPDALDAHPLVREWFGERLRHTNDAAWKAAHGRLYEHLRNTTKEGNTPSLEDLAPLYQAIAHGCRAGLYQKSLEEIYWERICQRMANGELDFYSLQKLGAFGSDLAAISSFFDKPYETPVAALTEIHRAWVLGTVAFILRAQGRFIEALPAQRAALRSAEDAKDWKNAAIRASNLSEAELLVGEVAAALTTAAKSVEYANRCGTAFIKLGTRTYHAIALHAAGNRSTAQLLFAEAEQLQKEFQPSSPMLYSVQGYRFCDLLLDEGQWVSAQERALKSMEIDRRALLGVALDHLTIGRAQLQIALVSMNDEKLGTEVYDAANLACAQLDNAVEALRTSGQLDDLPRGLLARAGFRRSVGDWDGAVRDLDEVEEIAGPGPMRLHLCDMALERARLAVARMEAFAPLNGLLEQGNSPKPTGPNAEQIADLKREAEKQLKIAVGYIEKCGYHRRDEELVALQAVLRDEMKFAKLLPRA
jgi:tetratricopeptide (TPR) repeat protein